MIRLLFGAFLAASLDLAFGVFAVIIASSLWHKPLSIPILCFGLFLAVLPDFDILLEILKTKNSTGEHKKSFFHIPLFFLPLVCLPLWLISGYLGTIALIALLWHYWHDFTEEGPGISLAPLSQKRFLLQFKKVPKWIQNYKNTWVPKVTFFGSLKMVSVREKISGYYHQTEKENKIFLVLSPKQLEKFYAETAKEWLEREYLRFGIKPITGFGTLLISLVIFATRYF
jgi:hypothetical protein